MKKNSTREYKLFNDYKESLKGDLKDSLKVIYTDLDGTLLNDRGCLFKDNNDDFFFDGLKLFREAEEKNWDIVPVSGRNKLQLRYNAMLMGLKNYISELGCEIVYDLGREAHTAFDSANFNFKVTRGGKDLVRIIDIMKKAFPRKIDSNIEWSMERNYNALFIGDIDLVKANALLEKNGYSGLTFVDNGFSKMFNLDLDIKHARIYNLIPAGVDKASAIRLDKEIRQFDSINCIALGDSVEDIKMAKEVHCFFLMKDAIERSPEIIDLVSNYDNVYITEQKMNRGWVEVIKYLAD